MDNGGEISDLLERRDTWSGRSVLWPIEGTDLRAPVDLAALPVYGRNREFDGFKGFGIVRLADAVIDAEGIGRSLSKPAAEPDDSGHVEELAELAREAPIAEDPWRGEKPVLILVPAPEKQKNDDRKIIRLEDRRAARGETPADPAIAANALSDTERSAFREIAERLREDERGKTVFGTRTEPPPALQELPPQQTPVEAMRVGDAEIAEPDEIGVEFAAVECFILPGVWRRRAVRGSSGHAGGVR